MCLCMLRTRLRVDLLECDLYLRVVSAGPRTQAVAAAHCQPLHAPENPQTAPLVSYEPSPLGCRGGTHVVSRTFRVSCLSCICVGVCVCAADHETLPTPTTTLNKLVYPLRSLWLDWRLWRQQRAFLASLSFVFVYLTVLSPGGMLASWLVYKHTSEILIGTRSKAEIL